MPARVLGIAGVSGNGQQALMALLREDLCANGLVRLFDHDVSRASPRVRRHLGLNSVPEERLGPRGRCPPCRWRKTPVGPAPMRSGPGGWLRLQAVRGMTQELIERFQVKASGPEASPARSLSGEFAEIHRGPGRLMPSPKCCSFPAHLGWMWGLLRKLQ